MTWNQIDAIVAKLPETTCEHGERHSWNVAGKGLAWERHFSKRDLKDLNNNPPQDEVIAFHVADEGEKSAWMKKFPETFFTIPHFDGYPAVLALRTKLTVAQTKELIRDAWHIKAPQKLKNQYPDI